MIPGLTITTTPATSAGLAATVLDPTTAGESTGDAATATDVGGKPQGPFATLLAALGVKLAGKPIADASPADQATATPGVAEAGTTIATEESDDPTLAVDAASPTIALQAPVLDPTAAGAPSVGTAAPLLPATAQAAATTQAATTAAGTAAARSRADLVVTLPLGLPAQTTTPPAIAGGGSAILTPADVDALFPVAGDAPIAVRFLAASAGTATAPAQAPAASTGVVAPTIGSPVSIEGKTNAPAPAAGPLPPAAPSAPPAVAATIVLAVSAPIQPTIDDAADAGPPAPSQGASLGVAVAPAAVTAVQAMPMAAPLATELPASQPADVPATAAGTSAEAAIDRQLDLARDSRWLDQLSRDIAGLAGRDGRLSFRLDPEHLGTLKVEVETRAEGAAIRLTADTEAARGIIADAQPRLLAEARAQGLRIAETHVDLSGQQGGQRFAEGQAGQQQGQAQRQGWQPVPMTAGSAAAPEDAGGEAIRRQERYA